MILSLVLPALIAGAGQADAKHRGALDSTNPVNNEASATASDHAVKEQHDKKMKNKGHWLENEKHEIDEDYQEALYKIKKSQLPDNLKEMLRNQAEENRSLALKQAEDRAELMKKHKAAREEYRDEFMKDKSNRKAVKETMDIL